MRILSLNQDAGIGPERKKGAAVHLSAMRAAFASAGHAVVAVDEGEDARAEAAIDTAGERFDLLYERFALGKDLGSRFCSRHGIPHVLELNAPLVEEQRAYRGSVAAETVEREARVFAGASLVVAVSTQVARYAVERGADADRVLVCPNAVDPQRFAPHPDAWSLREMMVPPGRFVLGFHGRLRPWHGLELLGAAMARLLADDRDVHLLFVGEGHLGTALPKEVRDGHVTHVPWVEHADVPLYVSMFDALPLTYAPDGPTYFSPLKLAEAMACGVVPVVPPLGDLGSLVVDGVTGLTYEAGDPDALARAVARLVDEPALRTKLSEGARSHAGAHTWEDVAAAVLARVSAAGPAAVVEAGRTSDRSA